MSLSGQECTGYGWGWGSRRALYVCACLENGANEVAPVAAAASYQPECCLAALVPDNSSPLLIVPVLGGGLRYMLAFHQPITVLNMADSLFMSGQDVEFLWGTLKLQPLFIEYHLCRTCHVTCSCTNLLISKCVSCG